MLIHPHIFAGGAEKAVVYLAYYLNKLGYKVAVCTLSINLRDLPSIAEHLYYITPENPIYSSTPKSTVAAIQSVVIETLTLANLMQNCLDDFELLSPCNFPAYWSTYIYRNHKPVVWISSEVFDPYDDARDLYDKSKFFRISLKTATFLDKFIVKKSVDKIITCSELNRKLIRKRYGLDAKVIPTGVDYDFFNSSC